MLRVFLSFFFLSAFLSAQHPTSHFILEKEGFCLEYDGGTKQPVWVCEALFPENFCGDADRSDFLFKEDKELPKSVRATLKDFHHSGLDRGHMAAAGNHTDSWISMRDSFLLSNISPQNSNLNRGRWKKLERHVRDLVEKYGKAIVLTGPLFLPIETEDGRRFVCFELIGDGGVAVPTHYFKVIKTSDFEEAYIFPNSEIPSGESLESFRATVKKIEEMSGIVF